MPQTGLETDRVDCDEEAGRLAALAATGILDTAPEPDFDAITQLAGEYFGADAAAIGFADEGRIWFKSFWGDHLHELPRKNSICDQVLAHDGSVAISRFSVGS